MKFAHLEAIGACTQQELYNRDVWSSHLEVVKGNEARRIFARTSIVKIANRERSERRPHRDSLASGEDPWAIHRVTSK